MKYTELPSLYLEKMRELLDHSNYEEYISSFDMPKVQGLRVNNLKLSGREFEQLSPFSLEPVPWTENGYYYREEEKPARDPYYYAGLYYLQEPTAMTPAALLPVQPGDRVLDLCAAPGGKSTELAAKLKGEGLLFSNDISNSRAKALLKNLELFGAGPICVTSESPEKLAEYLPEFFDKILVDAPCSGEGMFRKDSGLIKDWLEHGPDYYAPIQKNIVSQAVKMLRPGGLLLYSTCTFAKQEDEKVIQWILENNPSMELMKLPDFHGFARGFEMEECIRLFPHKIKGEGHFLGLMRKKDLGDGEKIQGNIQENRRKQIKMPEEAEKFLKEIKSSDGKERLFSDQSRLYIKEDSLYFLPKDFPYHARLRYLRTGLLLGQIKKNRFEPSQALAMFLKKCNYPRTISFSREDERVIRYLKGETIILKDTEKLAEGWCLVCAEGFPLGWAKGNKGVLKNKYYPGWRWQ